MLSVVIPVKDMHDITVECINNLYDHAAGDVDITIVDNNSDIHAAKVLKNVNIIRNDKNVGFWPSMLQGISMAESDYVLLMHNDVLIWEDNYDRRIIDEFILDNKLAAVGLFGGRGVGVDGGRGHPEGNMLGRKYGTGQPQHGYTLEEEHPAVVFDSLGICIDRKKLGWINPLTIPPHHWTDRLLCLRFIRAGFRCLTVGIAFDHGGGTTSTTTSMNTFSEDWCKENNLEFNISWENTLYEFGKNLYRKEFLELTQGRSELWVDREYRYYAR